eukprot:GEMP01011192.1.p1 GENE.GEMP01011192.1~~GEMP01011192.1.p1  ORF type:complete len:510 (+),score=65.12 GEMP01011192.1:132-1661(+)
MTTSPFSNHFASSQRPRDATGSCHLPRDGIFPHPMAQQGSSSRAASPASSWNDVPVKNTFLDFSDSQFGDDFQPSIEDGFRRSKSLEELKSKGLEATERENDLRTRPAPKVFGLPMERVGSWPTHFASLEDSHPKGATASSSRAPVTSQFITNDGEDLHIQQDSLSACASDDDGLIAEIAAFHGAAKRLGREVGQRRVCSWPGPSMADAAMIPSGNCEEDVEFALTIEEGEKPIKSRYPNDKSWTRPITHPRPIRHPHYKNSRSNYGANYPVAHQWEYNRHNGRHYSSGDHPQAQYDKASPLTRVSSLPNMDIQYPDAVYDDFYCNGTVAGLRQHQSYKITQFGGVEYAHNRVPKKKNLQQEFERANVPMTTIMIRNIPNRYKQNELVQEININELEGTYDFVYLPMDKSTTSNVGYAFVNFIEEQYAVRAMQIFTSYRFSKYQNISRKIASVSVAHIQGFDANLKHYQASAVNDGKVTDNRPLVLPQIAHRISQTTTRRQGRPSERPC